MDSLTQIVLGSAVAELALGKKIGNKAILWGAVCGTIPDLDVLLIPFLTDLQQLGMHRGFSHSIVFSCMLAPVLGVLLGMVYQKKEAKWWEWTLMCFLSLVTHPLLDAFTNYGTQLFLPFSDYRVAINTIFIVDPGYTVPMLLCLLLVLFLNKKKPARKVVMKLGFLLSHAYLLFTLGNKIYMNNVFEDAMRHKGIDFKRYMTYPMPLQNILWYCVAESRSGFYLGYYSWKDKDQHIQFQYIPKNNKYLSPEIEKSYALNRLRWFSDGFLAFDKKAGVLYANDLRFGKTGGLSIKKGEYVYKWTISNISGVVDIHQERNKFFWDKRVFNELMDRIKGIKTNSL